MRGFGKHIVHFFLALGLLAPGIAQAAGDQPSPTGKGIVGGALLGGEAVMLVEAAAGVKPGWAYAVGGGLGAIGGGVGGYFAECGGDPKIALYLLAGGMALALPTTVAVLSTTAYEPTNYTEDRPPPADEPVAEPPRAEPAPAAPAATPTWARSVPRERRAAISRLAPAILGVGQGEVLVSLPAVEVRQMYTRTEVATLGVKQRAEVSVPVLNVVF